MGRLKENLHKMDGSVEKEYTPETNGQWIIKALLKEVCFMEKEKFFTKTLEMSTEESSENMLNMAEQNSS